MRVDMRLGGQAFDANDEVEGQLLVFPSKHYNQQIKSPTPLSRPPHSPTSQLPAHHGTLDTLGLLLGALPCPLEEHYQVDLHIMRSQHRVRLEDARYLKGRGGREETRV